MSKIEIEGKTRQNFKNKQTYDLTNFVKNYLLEP